MSYYSVKMVQLFVVDTPYLTDLSYSWIHDWERSLMSLPPATCIAPVSFIVSIDVFNTMTGNNLGMEGFNSSYNLKVRTWARL